MLWLQARKHSYGLGMGNEAAAMSQGQCPSLGTDILGTHFPIFFCLWTRAKDYGF